MHTLSGLSVLIRQTLGPFYFLLNFFTPHLAVLRVVLSDLISFSFFIFLLLFGLHIFLF